jgi:hypothetical protein
MEMKELESSKEVIPITFETEMEVLMKIGVVDKIKSKFALLDVTLDKEMREISLRGTKPKVRLAKEQISKIRNGLHVDKDTSLESPLVQLFMSKNVNNFIDTKLRSNKIVAKWKVSNDRLEICCQGCLDSLKDCRDQILSAISTREISVDKQVPCLHNEEWPKTVTEFQKKFSEKIVIGLDKGARKISICATSDIVDDAFKDVLDFLDSSELITMSYNRLQREVIFALKHLHTEFEGIKQRLTVDIDIPKKGSCITLSGIRSKVTKASDEIQKLFNKFVIAKETFKYPGIKYYFKKMGDSIAFVENKCKCIILADDNTSGKDIIDVGLKLEEHALGSFGKSILYDRVQNVETRDNLISNDIQNTANNRFQDSLNGVRCLATYDVNGIAKVIVCHGDLTELKVDVIVRETDKNLDFSGSLGKTIIAKGIYQLHKYGDLKLK